MRLRRVLGGLAGCILLVLTYAVAVEPRLLLDERHVTWELPGLSGDDATVAVVGDLQVGMWWANTGMVERIVDRLVALDPDVVLLAGDFVYSGGDRARQQVAEVMRLLGPLLDADLPTFAVMGNHDHAADAVDLLTAGFRDRGVRVLVNEAVAVPVGGQDLHVVGIGSHRVGRSHPEAAFDDVPADAPRVVVMHNPASFPAIDAGRAPLAVAAHTHCGQVSIPGFPWWSWLELLREERVVVDGVAPPEHGAAGNGLFVTCGVGFSRLPMRLSARPQLLVLELVPAR